jgi:hypothetical protein
MKKSNTLSCIVYDSHSSPFYYELNKKQIRILIIICSVITTLSLLTLVLGAIYFKEIKNKIEKRRPVQIQLLKNANKDLQVKLGNLEKYNKSLETKLTSPSTAKTSSLSLFRETPGFVDRTDTQSLGIENEEVSRDSQGRLVFSFNLINLTPDQKRLAGHIFVMLKLGEKIFFYPRKSFPDDDLFINYNAGEYFATSRFRPVNCIFEQSPGKGMALFKILIFNRLGELIQKKIISKEL